MFTKILNVRGWTALAIALSALFTLATPVSTQAANDPARFAGIIGVVVNADGDRVASAVVALVNRDGEVVRRTRTNDRGFFHIAHVRPGRYVVRAAKRGQGAGHQGAAVLPHHITEVRVQISQ